MSPLWLARVFFAEGIPGNLTGVVLGDGVQDVDERQRLAARLAVPDTAFVVPNGDGPPALFSFSPWEELRFCTQTLLAAAAVEASRTGRSAACSFVTRVGPVTVTPGEPSGEPGLWWVAARPDPADLLADPRPLLRGLGLDDEAGHAVAGDAAIGGIGRRRLYVPLASEDLLQSVHPTPARILAACREHGLTGVCLFARRGPGEVALRVFTTSLHGAEDAATGGAALGLLGYDQRSSLGLADTFRVVQGPAAGLHRGCLHVRRGARPEDAGVGGQVALVLRGTLVEAG
jgi:PhzF family phenazine biosynthesis protein